MAVVLFALSTAISWSFYGERATEYLFGTGAISMYRYCYVFMVFVGSMLTSGASVDIWRCSSSIHDFSKLTCYHTIK